MTIEQKMKQVVAGNGAIKQQVDGATDSVRQSMEDAQASHGISQRAGNAWLQIGKMRASGTIAIIVLAVILLCYLAFKLLSKA